MSFMSNQQYVNSREIIKMVILMSENTPAEQYAAAISGMTAALKHSKINTGFSSKTHTPSSSSSVHGKRQSKNTSSTSNNKITHNKENQSMKDSHNNAEDNNQSKSAILGISINNNNDPLKVENKRSSTAVSDDAMTSLAQYAGQAVFPIPKGEH